MHDRTVRTLIVPTIRGSLMVLDVFYIRVEIERQVCRLEWRRLYRAHVLTKRRKTIGEFAVT